MDMEKVIEIIDELIFEAQKEPTWKAENALRCLKKELLKEQPEIIRCKDCKYYRQNTIYPGTNAILTYCAITGVIRDDPCWSCTDGERKD